MCRWMCVALLSVGGLLHGCGDSGETEADRIGVGAECMASAECESQDGDIPLECLTQFTGGYCGLEGCAGDADCPQGSGACTRSRNRPSPECSCTRLSDTATVAGDSTPTSLTSRVMFSCACRTTGRSNCPVPRMPRRSIRSGPCSGSIKWRTTTFGVSRSSIEARRQCASFTRFVSTTSSTMPG